MASAVPSSVTPVRVDFATFGEALHAEGVEESSILAATWCSFGTANIEALIDADALTVVHAGGIISGVGKRKMIGGGLKYNSISFSQVRSFGAADHEDPRGIGKFCIEFAGSGGVLLGRLQWQWAAKRFRDSRAAIMAVAEERDRILGVVEGLFEA
jgi:hypothetical protein